MAFVSPLPQTGAQTRIRPGPVSVLIVDADPSQRRSIAGMIAERSGGRFAARACATPAEAAAEISATPGTIIVADLDTIGGAGRIASMRGGRTIATSTNGSLSTAIAAVRGGAVDFLPKPIGAKALIERLEAAIREIQPAGIQPAFPAVAAGSGTDFAGFIGRSAAMQEVYEQIRRAAPSRAQVFITGESGTGKELAAEAIHAYPGDAARPLVAINCSAIPRDLMESEIFGHVRGAFTGATENRTGAAELADGGILFLDEIAEMDPGLQAKLLRFVQTGSFRRVGGSEARQVDVRIVSATNRDPFAEVAAGRLRADLFYRLHVLPIHLPPLRERQEDILRLAQAFLARFSVEEGRCFAGFASDAVAMLNAHSWPGNVRQLANVIRRAVVLDDETTVTAAMLPQSVRGETDDRRASTVPTAPYRDQERTIVEAALAACGGNVARAAAALQISPSTIYRKLQVWPEPAGGARPSGIEGYAELDG